MSQKLIVVARQRSVKFPQTGWLSTNITKLPHWRVLVEVRGRSGQQSWIAASFTVPVDALCYTWDWTAKRELKEGVYQVEQVEGAQNLHLSHADGNTEFILFSLPAHIVPEACEGEVIVLAKARGYSRTGRHGDRWSLAAARPGTVVAYEGYYRDDPVYVRVTMDGLVPLGESTATLPPSEW
jgi:hypothetical protein